MKTIARSSLLSFFFMISINAISAQEISLKHFKTTHYTLNIEIDYSEELVLGK